MEGGESVLDDLFEVGSIEDAEDVAMMEFEEGELVEQISKTHIGESSDTGVNQLNEESKKRNLRHGKKKRKNKRKGPNVTNINRFVLDVCKQLREKKSYLVWSAVGCLGVSALSDLVKEVGAIQACGGQKTTDGSRFRNGGGILWNILKIRDPNAYREIMRKGREFEKQFKQQNRGSQGHVPHLGPPKGVAFKAAQDQKNSSNGLEIVSHSLSQPEQSNGGQKRASVRDRIRMPVIYDDDLLGGEHAKMN